MYLTVRSCRYQVICVSGYLMNVISSSTHFDEIIIVNIYVGNLSYKLDELQLRDLFEAHGAVEKVTLIKDRETGQSRGFGFIEMTNDAEATAAIEAINEQNVMGRNLKVNEAKPRAERPARGGGRPGGGGGRNFAPRNNHGDNNGFRKREYS